MAARSKSPVMFYSEAVGRGDPAYSQGDRPGREPTNSRPRQEMPKPSEPGRAKPNARNLPMVPRVVSALRIVIRLARLDNQVDPILQLSSGEPLRTFRRCRMTGAASIFARAFMCGIFGNSFMKNGTRPQRINASSRMPSRGSTRATGILSVGATLYRGRKIPFG